MDGNFTDDGDEVNIGDSCVHPDTLKVSLLDEDRNRPAWWRVDLGREYDVYEVVIYNRKYYKGEY